MFIIQSLHSFLKLVMIIANFNKSFLFVKCIFLLFLHSFFIIFGSLPIVTDFLRRASIFKNFYKKYQRNNQKYQKICVSEKEFQKSTNDKNKNKKNTLENLKIDKEKHLKQCNIIARKEELQTFCFISLHFPGLVRTCLIILILICFSRFRLFCGLLYISTEISYLIFINRIAVKSIKMMIAFKDIFLMTLFIWSLFYNQFGNFDDSHLVFDFLVFFHNLKFMILAYFIDRKQKMKIIELSSEESED
jgi:hypothetical protein